MFVRRKVAAVDAAETCMSAGTSDASASLVARTSQPNSSSPYLLASRSCSASHSAVGSPIGPSPRCRRSDHLGHAVWHLDLGTIVRDDLGDLVGLPELPFEGVRGDGNDLILGPVERRTHHPD